MRLLDFPHTAYKVDWTDHMLYDGDSTSTIVLTGTVPSEPFRVQVRLYTNTGKTDCTGSVVVGTETLQFVQASKKVTSKVLTALPTVTTTGLTCLVEIKAIDPAGEPIQDETITAFKIRYEPTTKIFQNADGIWKKSQAYAMTTDKDIWLDTWVRYQGIDYKVGAIESFPWLDGNELYRIIYFF
jgi:hypothetical protein